MERRKGRIKLGRIEIRGGKVDGDVRFLLSFCPFLSKEKKLEKKKTRNMRFSTLRHAEDEAMSRESERSGYPLPKTQSPL